MKAIIFDFDGVLVNSEPLHWQAFCRVLEPLGLSVDYRAYLDRYVGYDDRDFFRVFFADQGLVLDEARLPRLVQAKAEAFSDVVAGGVEPVAGSVALVEACAGRWPLGLCSGALRSDIELILPRIGDGRLLERFVAVVTAEEVARSKPDPAGYLLAAERMGLEPGDCLAVEDTPAGIDSARSAGMKCLALVGTCRAEQLAAADRVVESLERVNPLVLVEWFGR